MKGNYYNIHEKVVQQRSITPETYRRDEVKFVKHKVLSINKTRLDSILKSLKRHQKFYLQNLKKLV